ncbi:hypothetical protein ACHAWT_002843 [Skeletonema menzelii]|mmetsp:Transcript_26764/g.44221  ORF Transcript_26764/g.44221 Transcript_26764/m.44221 type:complete len:148 (-) Transcript_26764:184-627(-)
MGRAFVLSLGEITLLGAALLSLGYFAGSNKKGVAASKQPPAFVLAVNLKFSTLTHRDTFLQLIDPVCQDVLANEAETTLSYKLAISDKDPLLVLVLERYSDKDHGYLKVHRSGTEFLNFREKLKVMQEEGGVVIQGESYLETELGYV